MNIDIRIIRGPLSPEQLRDIAMLYGEVDAKYRDVDYCGYIFNDNPFGYSLHAFACADNQAVGHISLIPMWIDTRMGKKLSYKAEAFYVMDKYRQSWIDLEEDELPLGLALPKAIYASVSGSETAVIHLLADEEIGKIHQFAGCIAIEIQAKERFLILDPQVYLSRKSSASRRVMIRTAYCYQKLISYLFCRRSKETVNEGKSLPKAMQLSIADAAQSSGWSISTDSGFKCWLLGSPYIRVYTAGSKACCVVRHSEYPGRATEILCCYSEMGASAQLAAILGKIVIEAKLRGASSVIFRSFSTRSLPEDMASVLIRAGFLSKTGKICCYVKSGDEYFLDPRNLSYNQFFYAQF
jgi:hypothetical protein